MIIFLYRHFKRKGHTPANIFQPVEKITYDENSNSRLKIIKKEYVYSYNNAKMFGQGSLFHSLY